MPISVLLLKIIAVGKIKDHLLQPKIEEYVRRISHDSRLEIVEIKDSTPENESLKIKEILVKDQGFVVVLSEEGRQYESINFARRLANINGKIIFIIGGPCGISNELKSSAQEILSLSKMTFTHEIARMLLLEQLYRAGTIINNRKYHKE